MNIPDQEPKPATPKRLAVPMEPIPPLPRRKRQPRKLFREQLPIIGRMVRGGMSWREIAEYLGVNEQTVHKWRRKGEDATRGIYHELNTTIRQAVLEVAMRCEDVIIKDITEGTVETHVFKRETTGEGGKKVTVINKVEKRRPPDANLALKWLERRRPDLWRQQSNLKHEGELHGTLTHEVGKNSRVMMIFDDGESEGRPDAEE